MLFVTSGIVRLAALCFAWIFVLASSSRERSMLAQRHARIRFVESAFKLEDESIISSSISTALRGRSQRVSASIVACGAEDAGTALYGQEASKAALLQHFNNAVTSYFIAVVLFGVISLLSGRWMRPFIDVCDWCFIAALCFILRPRADNPYLLLVDEYRFDVDLPPDWRLASNPPSHSSPEPAPPPPPPPPSTPPPPPPGPPPGQASAADFVPIAPRGFSRAQHIFMEANAAIPAAAAARVDASHV